MFVCICNGVTDRDIIEVASEGCRTINELTHRTGAGADCGGCLDMAEAILQQARASQHLPPLLDPQLALAA